MTHYRHLAILAVALTSWSSNEANSQPPCDLICHFRQAQAAEAKGRYAEHLTHARALAELAPRHPWAVYGVARGLALTGQREEAAKLLRRLAAFGDGRDLESDTTFRQLRELPDYRRAAARFRENLKPLSSGRVAFELPDADLLPEAVTFDPRRKRFLVGSLFKRKVVAVTPDGQARDFASAPDILRVVGIHADTARNVVWFASWAPRPRAAADTGESGSATRLFKADLETGRILARYAPRDTAASHLLNDLAIAPNGDVYLTDTDRGWIHRVGASSDTLEVFLRPDPLRFSYANGITMSPDGRALYVAFWQGVARVDLASRSVAMLSAPDTISTAGIDGLYFHGRALIAVQTVPGLTRVVQFALTADGRAIEGVQVLERGGDLMQLPTAGEVVGSTFYYIANSQYDRQTDGGELRPPAGAPQRSRVRAIELER